MVLKYIALSVPDVHAAEASYRAVFAMDVLFRESLREGDHRWYALPPDKGWEEVAHANLEVDMVALGRDDVVLAVLRGADTPRGVREVCVAVEPDDVGAIDARLPGDAVVMERTDRALRFRDPFGFLWSVHRLGLKFASSGELDGLWLDR
ncbi:MAG: hypothetical protein ACRDPZ_12715 [Gaiellaceae bacterium]